MRSLYLIGSLRNPNIPAIGQTLRAQGYDVFDDWFAGGPEADDRWKDYEKFRGHSFSEALKGYAARHTFEFDMRHLTRCDGAVLALPAGKSGHLELGWVLRTRPGFILLDDPSRWDVMYQLATAVCANLDDLTSAVQRHLPVVGE